MSIEINFALFHGIKLPPETDLREPISELMTAHPELFSDYHSYMNENEPATEDDIVDEWHDRGYILDIDGEAVFLGEMLYHAGSYSDNEISEFPKMPSFSDLPEEVAALIILYFSLIDAKVYSLTYFT